VPTLGYKGESTQEITASLTTRINALRRGARGLMLDVERSIPISELLSAPTVIELEGLGDDEDKAFVMGLLLVRLYEHRRAEYQQALADAAAAGRPAPRGGVLSHVVVIEEAHRLLAEAPKAGRLVSRRSAGRVRRCLLADAFRDPGLWARHDHRRPGAGAARARRPEEHQPQDRPPPGGRRRPAAMAAAMAMDATQATVLSTLPLGHAAVFSEGDHTPVMVAVRPAKAWRTHRPSTTWRSRLRCACGAPDPLSHSTSTTLSARVCAVRRLNARNLGDLPRTRPASCLAPGCSTPRSPMRTGSTSYGRMWSRSCRRARPTTPTRAPRYTRTRCTRCVR